MSTPQAAAKPTPEEEAILNLFHRYVQKKGFSEELYRSRPDWQSSVGTSGVTTYTPTEALPISVRHRFKGAVLTGSEATLPDGRIITYLFTDYEPRSVRNTVPRLVTIVLDDKGTKTYKRLSLKNIEIRKQ